MKKQLTTLAACFVTALFIFSSCTTKDNNPPPKTKTQLISQSTWKFKTAFVSTTDVSNQDPPFAPCRKDNILTFTAAGGGSVSEGATSCSPAENSTFTWNFASNETMLHISAVLFPGGSNDFTLVSLTETELVVSFPYNFNPTVSVIVVVTFQH